MNKLEKFKKSLRESISRQLPFADIISLEIFAKVIEDDLPPLLREAFGVEVESIYDITSASQVRDYRNRMVIEPSAKAMDEAADGRLNQALKLYADFLDSKFNPAKKKPKALKTQAPAQGSIPETPVYVEGATVQQTVDRRERNPRARQECIDNKGCRCAVCGFDFEKVYGDVGRGYIEVHHLLPISQTDDEHEVSWLDLVPLCANCHAMAHRRSPNPYTPEEIIDMINDNKQD